MKSFILFLLFASVTISASFAQITSVVTAHATNQAPDDVLTKLSSLIHAAKYADASKSVDALLTLYPDDQRLVKAKALLDKLLAAPSAPSASSVAPAPPASAGTPAPLTGMDKVEYNALLELARQVTKR